ncbi:hypothetical protein VOLCADRAFT_92613 [Volvox carteri f. nagariensis]|uniref:BACK domain-containing protein n=1 Tax=Volvox carteri f. nagariensis TaxID=3068 RepID=D8U038_VOLCA|nr:uncharacterized protein VOLCADRAFT_92613 [Volvox carteri f. nagariensis]EFJ46799.1 hypothetical protein VOLCADRAFT_92613 [Volvox carteri f. nagariensis]|eukprot:XP_002952008.1 hypothetical protein VOLCADRAFT_92613 [Volvox carteri f. nagariensis]
MAATKRQTASSVSTCRRTSPSSEVTQTTVMTATVTVSHHNRLELCIPLGCKEDLYGNLAALQYMYTGELRGCGGGGGAAAAAGFSVAELLAIRSQATYLQVEGCAEACDRELLHLLTELAPPSSTNAASGSQAQGAAQSSGGGSSVSISGGGSGGTSGGCTSFNGRAAAAAIGVILGGPGAAVSAIGGGRDNVRAYGRSGGGNGGVDSVEASAAAAAAAIREGVVPVLQFAERCPAAAAAASFVQVVDACRRHLVSHFSEVITILNSPSLRRQLAALPSCALELLLGCSSLRADSEASVLQLLAVWLAANPSTPPSRCTALCRRIRAAHLGRTYLAFVLPCVDWWPMGHRQQLRTLHLASATAAERRALSELAAAAVASAAVAAIAVAAPVDDCHYEAAAEVDKTKGDDGGGDADAWSCASPRDPSNTVHMFRWNLPRKALIDAICSGGDAAVTFDGGMEAVSFGGFEWSVFVKPPRSDGCSGGDGDDGSGEGSSGGSILAAAAAATGAGGRRACTAAAGVYLICSVPAEVENGYQCAEAPGSGGFSAKAAPADGGGGGIVGGGGLAGAQVRRLTRKRISGITSVPSACIEVFRGRSLPAQHAAQMAPPQWRRRPVTALAAAYRGGGSTAAATAAAARSAIWGSLLAELSDPDSPRAAAATLPPPPLRLHPVNGNGGGGPEVAAVVKFGPNEVFKFGPSAPGRGICDVLALRSRERDAGHATELSRSVRGGGGGGGNAADGGGSVSGWGSGGGGGRGCGGGTTTLRSTTASASAADLEDLRNHQLAAWLPYLHPLEAFDDGTAGGGLAGTLTLRSR